MDQGPLEAMRAFGYSEADLAEIRAWIAGQEQTVKVWPCNWDALQIFQSLDRQWDYFPSGHRQGIKRPAIESTLNLMGIKKGHRANLFTRIMVLEKAALEAMD